MKRFPWWKGIKQRVIMFVLLISIVPLATLGLISINSAKVKLVDSIHMQNMNAAKAIADDISQFIVHTLKHVQMALDLQEDTLDDENIRKMVGYSLMKEIPEIEKIVFFDQNRLQTSAFSKREIIFHDEDVETVWDIDQEIVYDPVYFESDGRPILSVYVPVHSFAKGELAAILKLHINLRSFIQNATDADKNGYYYVIDQHGKLIGHEDFSQVLFDISVSQSESVQYILQKKDPLAIVPPFQYETYNQVEVLGAYALIPELQWGVIIEQPVKEALKPIYDLYKRFIFSTFVLIAVVVITSLYFGLRFTKPILELRKGAGVIAKGNLDFSIVRQGEGEIAELIDAFNHMTQELKYKTQDLLQEKQLLHTVVSGVGVGLALLKGDQSVIWTNQQLQIWLDGDQYGSLDQAIRLIDYGSNEQNRQNQEKDIQNQEKDGQNRENDGQSTTEYGRNQEQHNWENGKDDVIAVVIDDEKKYFRQQIFYLTQGNSEDPQYLKMIEDITDARSMEAMVIQADKLAAIGVLASGVAHEINNPLHIINLYTQEITEQLQNLLSDSQAVPAKSSSTPPLSETTRDALQGIIDDMLVIQQQVERTAQITRSLLNFSRQSEWQEQPLSINELLLDSVQLLHYPLKKAGIVVVTQLQEPLPLVIGSGVHMQQVFFNLIINAMDALPDGGEITIHSKYADGQIYIGISDNGTGIKGRDLDKIFDPFFTTKPSGKGTGLGLSICYGIITSMQGTIKVDSQAGTGTTFTITIPV